MVCSLLTGKQQQEHSSINLFTPFNKQPAAPQLSEIQSGVQSKNQYLTRGASIVAATASVTRKLDFFCLFVFLIIQPSSAVGALLRHCMVLMVEFIRVIDID